MAAEAVLVLLFPAESEIEDIKIDFGGVVVTGFEDLYLDGNFLPAVFTQPLMAEMLTPCICDNSVGNINSSVTFATIASLSFFEKSLAVLFRELIRDKAPGGPVTLALLEYF